MSNPDSLARIFPKGATMARKNIAGVSDMVDVIRIASEYVGVPLSEDSQKVVVFVLIEKGVTPAMLDAAFRHMSRNGDLSENVKYKRPITADVFLSGLAKYLPGDAPERENREGLIRRDELKSLSSPETVTKALSARNTKTKKQ